jgi:uncharacterized protein YeeX (DUF496 family)
MIKKIDADTFEIITETKETVSLSQLKDELKRKQEYNNSIRDIHKELLNLPEQLRQYIYLPLFEDTSKEEELLNKLKDING